MDFQQSKDIITLVNYCSIGTLSIPLILLGILFSKRSEKIKYSLNRKAKTFIPPIIFGIALFIFNALVVLSGRILPTYLIKDGGSFANLLLIAFCLSILATIALAIWTAIKSI